MENLFECTREAIASSSNPCEYVQLHCGNHTKYLNFIDFYYCTLDQGLPITILLSLIFVFVIFNLLKTTADKYLAPSLEAISDKLKMSETLAGVTLVAFANGATDVIAGLSAGGKEEGGIQIAIGALFGATLFTITCVLARCIQGAGEIQVNADGLKRDIGFLLIAVGYFIVLSIVNTVTPALTFGFFVIYITYFLFILKQERKGKEKVETIGERMLSIKMDFMKTSGLKACSEGVLDNIFHPARIRKPSFKQMEPLIRGKSAHILRLPDYEDDHEDLTTLNEMDEIGERLKWAFLRRFMKVMNAPFFFIRDLTMPPFEEDNWNLARAMVTPFCGGLFVLWQLGFLGGFVEKWYFWLIYFSITTPISVSIFIYGRKEGFVENHPGRFAGATFVIAAFWLSLIVTCFMDFLSLLTLISGLPLTYLSLTIVAWGNSFDNFFIDYVISKSGHGKLAVTGVFSGKIFNLLVGFGSALLIQSLSGPVKLNLYDFSSQTVLLSNLLVGVIIIAIIGCLLSLLAFGREYNWIFDSPNACQYVRENCESHFSIFNFLELYYCNMNHSLALIILFSIVFGILIFNFIGAIADSYLAPSIQVVSKKLKLSDTFSGITLLAFAASAPDVITGIVAGGKEEGGPKVVIGGLFGACLFTVTIVLAGCILGMKQIHADKRALRRDIGCLLISVLYFMVLTIVGKITPLSACGFFVIYVLFFAYVVYEERKKKRREKIHEERLLMIEDEDEDIWDSDKTANHGKFEPKSAMHIRKKDKDLEFNKESKSEGHLDDEDDECSDMEVSTLRIRMKESLRRAPSRKYIEEKTEDNQVVMTQARPHQVLHPSIFKPHHDESGKQSQILDSSPAPSKTPKKRKPQSAVKKIIRMINVPILFIGDLTMPSFEKENWNVYTTALTPVFGSLFVLSELGLIGYFNSHWVLWIVFGVSMILLSIFIFIKGHKKNLAEKYPGIFAPITLIVSLFWLNLITSLLVDFLMFIQIITDLSLYFLSITILAWGNSLEDFFVNYAISRKGFGKVALGGVYGSQIFAILIGFGGGIFRLALKNPIVLNLYEFGRESWRENVMTLFLLASTCVVLGLTLVVGKLSHWTLAKKTVVSVLGFYAVFIVALTLIAFI